jgi:hypothetical protein
MMKRILALTIFLIANLANATIPSVPTASSPYQFNGNNYEWLWFANDAGTTATLLSKAVLDTLIDAAAATGDGSLIIDDNTLLPAVADVNGSVNLRALGTGVVRVRSNMLTTGTLGVTGVATAAEVTATTGTFTDLLGIQNLTLWDQNDDPIMVFDGIAESLTMNLGFATTLTPFVTNTTDLGSVAQRWRILYGGSAYLTGNVRTSGTLTAQGLTASSMVVTDANKGLATNSVTATEAGYLSGTTGTIQTQLNAKYESGAAPTFATVDTGQGANELYDMDQNVLTTSAVEFDSLDINSLMTINNAGTITGPSGNYSISSSGDGVLLTLDTGQGVNELFDMDQNVQTTDSPTFAGATLSAATPVLAITGTDAGATGAVINLYHDSASPAASDSPGIIRFQGEDSGGNQETYGTISTTIGSATHLSEAGYITFTPLGTSGRVVWTGALYQSTTERVSSMGAATFAGVNGGVTGVTASGSITATGPSSVVSGVGGVTTSGGPVKVGEMISAPTNPSSGGETLAYMKGDKYIISYNHGGTMKYRYFDLTSTDATWTYTTTAP